MTEQPAKAWQPFTFGGVARYAHDSIGRLFVTCLIIAAAISVVVTWAVSRAWAPVIAQAIARLPDGAEIRGGQFTTPQSICLAETAYLSLWFEPIDRINRTSGSDIQVIFMPSQIRFRSLVPIPPIAYQPHWTIPLNRAEIQPKWEAWKPAIYANLLLGTFLYLWISWIALGAVYAILLWPIAYIILRRSVSLWGAGKLAIAALMPGAVLMLVAIAFYALGQVRLMDIAVTLAIHFVVGWIFLIGATFKLPVRKKKTNPFKSEESEPDPPKKPRRKNPFKTAQ